MLPLFPYNGILRPAIMLAATAAAFAILKRMKKSVHYRKLLFAACLAYLLFLIYATFLSCHRAKKLRKKCAKFRSKRATEKGARLV